jgi:hypothetical protein
MTTASNTGAAGQYCNRDTSSPTVSDADDSDNNECPLTLLLFSRLHTDGPLFGTADPVTGALVPG